MNNEAAQDHSHLSGELLRQAMRRWVSGVAVCTSQFGDQRHGMTVNSFVSISLEPPLVSVNMHNATRTFALVQESNVFAVTVLSVTQQSLAELFAGRRDEHGDRLAGIDTFSLVTGAPLLRGGLAFVDCRVVGQYPLTHSTLVIGEVVAALISAEAHAPLVYFNRAFSHLPGL